MKYSFSILLAFILFSSSTVLSKPNIHILATGGTIAGVGESDIQTKYNSGEVGIDELIEAVPEMKELANITGEQIVDIGSQDMSNDVWLKLAKRINQLLNSNSIDGIVITHGTDTMEETAFFLNLTVKSDKPVVLVGSMRPSTEMSADGPLNLYNAVAVASDKQSFAKGVLVAMNGEIISARSVQKGNTVDVQTFNIVNKGVLGYIFNSKVFYNQISTKKHTITSDFDISEVSLLPKVGIIYGYSDIQKDMVEPIINSGYEGIIFAGVGNGNIHKNVLPTLVKARDKDIFVVRSSRVATGPTTLNAEFDDEKYEFIASVDLNPQKARILLMLSLLNTKDWKKIQTYFNEY